MTFRLFYLITISLLVLYILLHWFYAIFPVKDFESVILISEDTLYQTEEFLLALDYPNIQMMNSGPVAYGIEPYYLIPIFKIVELILGQSDPLYAYYILIIFHIVSASLALFIFSKLIFKYTGSILYPILFLATSLTSPLFFFNFSYIKPDPTIVLLCSACALWCIDKSATLKSEKYFLIAILFASLGFAFKWWTLLLLPTFLFLYKDLQFYKINTKFLYFTFISFLIVIFSVYFTIQNELLISLQKRLPFFVEDDQLSASLIAFLFFGWVSLFIFITYVNYKQNDFLKIVKIYISPFALFSVWVLIFQTPLLLEFKRIVISIYYFIGRFFIKSYTGTSDTIGLFNNVVNWLSLSWNESVISPFTIILIVASIYLIKNQRIKLIKYYSLWLFSLMSFMFILVARNSSYALAMLYPVLLCWIFLSCNSHRFKPILVSLICLQILYQNFTKNDQQIRIISMLENRQKIPQFASSVKNEVDSFRNQSHPSSKIFLLNRNYPTKIDHFERFTLTNLVKEKRVQRFNQVMNQMSPDDLLLLVNRQNEVINQYDNQLHLEHEISLIDIDNNPYKIYFYQKGDVSF